MRCSKGKPCYATCIHRGYLCSTELPPQPSKSLPKARDLVEKTVKKSKENSKLPPIRSSEDFAKKLESTKLKNNPLLQEAHGEINPLKKPSENTSNALIQKLLAKVKSIENLNKLTKAIKEYTGEDYKPLRAVQKLRNLIRSEGDALPRGLKNKTPEQIERLGKKAELIEKFLKLLPKPKVEKFRGLAVESDQLAALLEQVKNKGVSVPPALTSWSTKLDVAKGFADDGSKFGNRPHRVIFQTVNKKGSSIMALSERPDEHEILTPSKAKFKFMGYNEVTHDGEKYHVFNVQEV